MVSEPLGDELPGAWNEVPESSWGVIKPGDDEIHAFEPEAPAPDQPARRAAPAQPACGDIRGRADPGEIAGDVDRGGRERRGEHHPAMPKKAPARSSTTRMSSGFILSVAPIAIG